MAVKTIAIDLEAYEALARRKRPNESFSQVIKRAFKQEANTAAALLAHLPEVCFAPATLDAIEEQAARLDAEYPEDPLRS